MSYPQFQAASDYLGAIADEDYVKALPSNSYEDRGGAVLDGPEAGYKVTYTQADAEAVTAEDGRVILMDEHLADSDAMDYDMDRWKGVCMRICMQRIKRVDVPKVRTIAHIWFLLSLK